MKTDLTDDLLMNNWYQYAAKQKGFVGNWLDRLREQQKITPDQQRHNLGASKEDFVRLQGIPLPRPNQFTRDAKRIAEACHLTNPSAFVQAMLLARSLGRDQGEEISKSHVVTGYSYQAAYDADEDLDEQSEEDEK